MSLHKWNTIIKNVYTTKVHRHSYKSFELSIVEDVTHNVYVSEYVLNPL